MASMISFPPPDSKIGPELNKLNVSIVENEICKLTYGNLIKETNICADSVEGQGTCRGDSGSVLQWRQPPAPSPSGVWIQAWPSLFEFGGVFLKSFLIIERSVAVLFFRAVRAVKRVAKRPPPIQGDS